MRGWVWFYEKKREKIILLFPIERAASVLSRVLDRKSNLQVRESDFLSVKKQYFGFDEKYEYFLQIFRDSRVSKRILPEIRENGNSRPFQ